MLQLVVLWHLCIPTLNLALGCNEKLHVICSATALVHPAACGALTYGQCRLVNELVVQMSNSEKPYVAYNAAAWGCMAACTALARALMASNQCARAPVHANWESEHQIKMNAL